MNFICEDFPHVGPELHQSIRGKFENKSTRFRTILKISIGLETTLDLHWAIDSTHDVTNQPNQITRDYFHTNGRIFVDIVVALW